MAGDRLRKELYLNLCSRLRELARGEARGAQYRCSDVPLTAIAHPRPCSSSVT